MLLIILSDEIGFCFKKLSNTDLIDPGKLSKLPEVNLMTSLKITSSSKTLPIVPGVSSPMVNDFNFVCIPLGVTSDYFHNSPWRHRVNQIPSSCFWWRISQSISTIQIIC
ncbi:MAG: hypothetical protein WAT79_11065 [Saprospiraceae bacterium]